MKKFLSIILAAAMVLALAGCGSSSDSSSAAESAASEEPSVQEEPAVFEEAADESAEEPAEEPAEMQEPAEETAEEPEEPAPEPAEEEPSAAVVAWPDEPITFTLWTHANDGMFTDLSVLDTNPALAYATEETNISLKVSAVARSAASDQFNLMIAGGDYPDLINRFVTYYTGSIAQAVEDDIIIDMSGYLEDYAPNYYGIAQNDPDFFKDMKTDEGIVATLYAMTTYADGGPIAGGYIRQDWLDELGLEKPVTYDEYHEVLNAFKSAYGCTNTLMLTEDIFPENYCLIAGYDTSYDFYVRDGKISFGPIDDGYREFLQMLNEWYAEGLFSSDFLSISGGMSNSYEEYVGNDNAGIWFCMARQDNSWDDLLDKDASTAVSALQDAVKNPDDQTHLGYAARLIGNDGVSISTACPEEYIEYAVQYLDYWFSDTGIMLVNYGIEGLTYEYNDAGEPEYTDMIENNPDGLSKVQAQFAYCLIHLLPSQNTAAQSIVSEDHSTWAINKDGSYELPTTLSMTTDEGIIYNDLYNDIDTYVDEMTARFITGESSLDEWDTYVENINNMGIADCIEIVQAEYDRYMAR